ncbi:MAG: peptidase M61 [Rudaea sp.]|uniref:M61 family metallopeptidase n=1 Tax=Rudaea sp. TaxID=2136325 RepID=UPI0039E3BB8A
MPKLASGNIVGFVLGALPACVGIVPAHAQARASDTVEVVLRPGPADAAQDIAFVDVTVTAPADLQAPGFRLPRVTGNVKTVATSIENLRAADENGSIALDFRDDPDGAKPYRRWKASRPAHGQVTIRYRAPITNAPNPLGAAPPLELRSDSVAFSGLLGAYVLLPDTGKAYRLKLEWDFSSLAAESIGVSTLGVGNQSGAEKTSEMQESTFTLGGHLDHEPATPAANGFFSAWQGRPPFDAHALMRWTQTLYGAYQTFFATRGTTYNVFLRRNPVNPGGGVEVANSFVGTFDDSTRADEFKLTLAHEMVHTFVGELDEKDDLAASWFSEGIAVYYERLLPYRAGQITRDEYLRSVNITAARYYTDLLNTTPNRDIPARFWADTRIRVLPYDRGALYFARLNALIGKASRGRRSLDDLLLAFLKRRATGLPLTQAAWVDAVTRELGAQGKSQFDDMMSGKPIVLDSDTFGPCFCRTQQKMRRYELGFDPEVLAHSPRIVRGLVAGSAAEKAGLRNGDEIARPVPQDGIQANQSAMLKLRIKRDGANFDVDYLPRGESVETWQWTAAGSEACRTGK